MSRPTRCLDGVEQCLGPERLGEGDSTHRLEQTLMIGLKGLAAAQDDGRGRIVGPKRLDDRGSAIGRNGGIDQRLVHGTVGRLQPCDRGGAVLRSMHVDSTPLEDPSNEAQNDRLVIDDECERGVIHPWRMAQIRGLETLD